MKAAVITFPGSNCDDDLVFTLAKSCEYEVERLWHKDTPSLDGFDLIAIPGGFTYGDYLRCGAIAALSPIVDKVRDYASRGGFVIGICNGFQILCETGLLPGALAKNERLSFVCRDVTLKAVTNDSPWTCDMKPGELLTIPIAHGDGRYVIADAERTEMERRGQILFTYTDAKGHETKEANPNGSTANIAGVCNATKNVFGMMPHPERATDLRTRDGLKLWKSVTRILREKKA